MGRQPLCSAKPASLGEERERKKLVRRNQGQVEIYLDSLQIIHRSSAASEVPAGKESKGMRQYVSPISTKGFDHIDDPGNKEAAILLFPIFVLMRRERFDLYYAAGLVGGWYAPPGKGVEQKRPLPKPRIGKRERYQSSQRPEKPPPEKLETIEEARKARTGQGFRDEVEWIRKDWEVRYEPPTPGAEEPDHGILKRWKAGADRGKQDDVDALSQFRAACKWAAERLPEGTLLDVSAYGGRQARSLKQAAAQDRRDKEKEQRAATYRKRYAEFRTLEAEYPDANRGALKAIWSERNVMSVATIERAIRFCERHEWSAGDGTDEGKQLAGKPVEPHLRWEEGVFENKNENSS